MADAPLLHVPLDALHRKLGGQMVPFGGYEMPVRYGSIQQEHEAVRQRAGLFDVSHMSNLWVRGSDAAAKLSKLSTADATKMKPGGTKYTTVLREDGTIIDDMYFFCLQPDLFHVVPNAGMNTEVADWFRTHGGAKVEDVTRDTAILALQGPRAAHILQKHTDFDLTQLKPFKCTTLKFDGVGPFLVSRTGYTGEDGFELFPPAREAERIFTALLATGKPDGLVPVGLGARDTLRLEKAFCLAGHEFAGGRTPLEASLDKFINFEHDFIGKKVLEQQRAQGVQRKLVGLLVEDRGIPRQGCEVRHGAQKVGEVSSGTLSPNLRKGIALAYVQPRHAAVGTELSIIVRDTPSQARVVETPFVR